MSNAWAQAHPTPNGPSERAIGLTLDVARARTALPFTVFPDSVTGSYRRSRRVTTTG